MQGLNVCHHKPLLTVCGGMCTLTHLARCMIWSADIPQASSFIGRVFCIISCLEMTFPGQVEGLCFLKLLCVLVYY